jgi:uncharacterized protein (TIGR03083 family)
VTDETARLRADLVDAFAESLAGVGALVLDPLVGRSWTDPSPLAGYSVGGVAGHVLSLMVGFHHRLRAPAAAVDLIPYIEWYGPALRSDEPHQDLIDMGEKLAEVGPQAVAAQLADVSGALIGAIRAVPAGLAVPLRSSPRSGVGVEDFLRTRFVEVVVHANDLASGAGLPRPRFSEFARAVVADVLAEASDGADGLTDDPRLRMTE